MTKLKGKLVISLNKKKLTANVQYLKIQVIAVTDVKGISYDMQARNCQEY